MVGSDPKLEPVSVAPKDPGLDSATAVFEAAHEESLQQGDASAPNQPLTATGTGLSEFFARPVLIASQITSAGFSYAIAPWQLYAVTASVQAKLKNFHQLRGRLHVRITLSNNPYTYGMYAATLTPLQYSTRNQYTACQTNHAFIDFNTDAAVELELPFVHDRYLSVSPYDSTELSALATLRIYEWAPLRRADGAAVVYPTLRIYAWLSEVELFAPTPFLAAGKQLGDEQGRKGPISGVASTVASVAKVVQQVPFLAPFAKATEIAAGVVGGIASIFGFSRPTFLPEAPFMTNRAFGFWATSQAHDAVPKLTLDPRSEMPLVDSLVPTSGVDDLAIMPFTRRWGLVKSGTWAMTDAVDTAMFTVGVTPYMSLLTSASHWLPTPLAHFALPFSSWRGGMQYRLIIPASAFHRGKLWVYHNPNQTTNTVPPTDYLNTTVGCMVDLSQGVDLTFEISHANSATWFWTPSPVPLDATWAGSATTGNGFFNAIIFELLSAPAAGSTVSYFLFQRAAEDFEVAVPSGNVFRNFIAASRVVTEGPPLGVEEVACDLRVSPPSTRLAEGTYGECVVSLRQLAKRYAPALAFSPWRHVTDTSNQVWGMRIPLPLYAPVVRTTATVVNPWVAGSTYALFNPMSWILACFHGVRGSAKVKACVYNNWGQAGEGWIGFGNGTPSTYASLDGATGVYLSTASLTPLTFTDLLSGATEGIDLKPTAGYFNIAEAEISPQHGRQYFEVSDTSGSLAPEGGELMFIHPNANPVATFVTVAYAIGDDFQPVFFLGTQILVASASTFTWSSAPLS